MAKEKDQDDTDLTRYANDTMPEEEREAFEQRLASDPGLAAEAEFYRKTARSIALRARIAATDEKLQGEGFFSGTPSRETPNPHRRRRPVPLRRWLVAASVSLLVLAGGWALVQANYSDWAITDLAEDKMGIATSLRSRPDLSLETEDDTPADPFAPGLEAYLQGAFAEAEAFFNAFPTDSELYPQAQLTRSLALLKMGDHASAARAAEAARTAEATPAIRQKADWALAQALLLGKQYRSLETLLEQIAADEAHLFFREAEELLSRLASPWRNLVL